MRYAPPYNVPAKIPPNKYNRFCGRRSEHGRMNLGFELNRKGSSNQAESQRLCSHRYRRNLVSSAFAQRIAEQIEGKDGRLMAMPG